MYVWRYASRDPGEKEVPEHEAILTCRDLEFALKVKGILQHLDPEYRITLQQSEAYQPLLTSRPVVPRLVLEKVNRWLNERGIPPLEESTS